jgi:hypothetical protein
MKMAIKNYTTQIRIEKTIAEVESILAEAGANAIFKMYDEQKQPAAIAFKLWLPDIEKELAFKLPMEAEKILSLLKQKGIPKKLQCIEQAHRVGWRVIKDWLDAQMALIKIRLVKPQQVFLPYMYDQRTDSTLYDKIESQGFQALEYQKQAR